MYSMSGGGFVGDGDIKVTGAREVRGRGRGRGAAFLVGDGDDDIQQVGDGYGRASRNIKNYSSLRRNVQTLCINDAGIGKAHITLPPSVKPKTPIPPQEDKQEARDITPVNNVVKVEPKTQDVPAQATVNTQQKTDKPKTKTQDVPAPATVNTQQKEDKPKTRDVPLPATANNLQKADKPKTQDVPAPATVNNVAKVDKPKAHDIPAGRTDQSNTEAQISQPEDQPRPRPYIPPRELEGDAAFADRKKYYEGSGINFASYDDIDCNITSQGTISPSINSIEEMGLCRQVFENAKKCGYKSLTPIQKHAAPQLMEGLDLMACAQTGCGKTAAFLLPIINVLIENQDKLNTDKEPVRPEVLILAPTRELAVQINREARLYSQGSILKTIACYGGAALFSQRNEMQENGCNILTATPGRLLQFVDKGIVSLENVQIFILDEADRMLDLGFMGDVKRLVMKMRPTEQRVTGMFSATFPVGIQKAAFEFLKPSHVFVTVGIVGGACCDVEQEFLLADWNQKKTKLLEIIQEIPTTEKVLVFCNTREDNDLLSQFLKGHKVARTAIHGGLMQEERELALGKFIKGRRPVLIATGVAARGLDVPNVSLVINYDLPNEIEEYVQRIGRTGRVGHTGKSISFFNERDDKLLASSLRTVLRGANQQIPYFLEQGADDDEGVDVENPFAVTWQGPGVPKTIEGAQESWE